MKLVVVASFLLSLRLVALQECFGKEKVYSLFGTKTFYKHVARKLHHQPRGCTPVFVYMVARHGARHPGKSAKRNQEELLELAQILNSTGKASLCDKDLKRLRQWEVWSDQYSNYNLTSYGRRELKDLAIRYQQFLPQILSTQNSPTKYKFTSTSRDRVIHSKEAFMEALFHNFSEAISRAQSHTTSSKDDPLRFSENCDSYKRQVKNNPNLTEEFRAFVQGSFVTGIARRVACRLGIPRSAVTNEKVLAMYRGCYEERWMRVTTTPWCRVFKSKDLKLLEYGRDIADYPVGGYKFPITHKQSCFLTKEIVNAIKNASVSDSNGAGHLLGNFRFVSSSNVVTLAGNMRLYKNEPDPTAKGFHEQRRRSFRSSFFSPSAANIAFVLYRCDHSSPRRTNQRGYKIQTYWNEKLLTSYPACLSATKRHKGLCDIDTWLESYQDFVFGSSTECSQEEICA